ncbi:amino acid ABC transporter substrate-binding protein, PAAT family [Pseudooceanicola antarcticus]|uniref:Amino acid ABC transporter n=1 Tax=Pseudooceanicola antarcticus TaxID=1247613 RepID=A0A285JDV9_9RHOB|nr:transporter substrate-binding domain-containing protein [Pseudooceanicola antarcticus]PJE30838.1 amino acid ABC transporter [Pseudooceanicola antarcticus]SNY57341.1 amino acid ABC transporter substrate-binding protein, PAAT family [Pseudooceanicola antarcticus]
MNKIILSTALLALTASGALAQDVIRMGTEGQYPPYNMIGDSGEVEGFEIDLGNELCERAGLTCEWVINDWDSIIPNLVSGNYDTIIAGMSITAERDEVIDFTQDYYPPTGSIYIALEDGVDLEGGVVAAQTGTIQAGYVAETGATLLEFATPDETIAAVQNGEADAVFADKDFLLPYTESGELMVVGEEVPLGGGVGMGLRESDTELKAKFDAAITSMKEDGTLNTLLDEYFGEGTGTY